MRARDCRDCGGSLVFWHIGMTDGGKYHPPLLSLLFSFCSQYKSKKISPGVTFWILCTKMQVCTRFGSWRPPCIFQNLFIITYRRSKSAAIALFSDLKTNCIFFVRCIEFHVQTEYNDSRRRKGMVLWQEPRQTSASGWTAT